MRMMTKVDKAETGKILHDFLSTTSLKSIPKVVKAQTYWMRVLWIFAFFVGASVAGAYVFTLVYSYSKYETTTIVKVSSRELLFPDATVCNLNPLANLPLPTKTIQNYRFSLDPSFHLIENSTLFHYAEELLMPDVLFENYLSRHQAPAKDLTTFVIDCVWVDASYNAIQCQHMIPKLYLSTYGFCYTLQPENRRDTQELSLIFYIDSSKHIRRPSYGLDENTPSADGVVLSVHDADTLPSLHHGCIIETGRYVIMLLPFIPIYS